MSPEFMASQSGCSDACSCMPGLRRRIRCCRIAGFSLIVLALAAIGASLPVEGLARAGLAIAGIVAVGAGWYLVVRRAGRFEVELKAAAASTRSRGRNR